MGNKWTVVKTVAEANDCNDSQSFGDIVVLLDDGRAQARAKVAPQPGVSPARDFRFTPASSFSFLR